MKPSDGLRAGAAAAVIAITAGIVYLAIQPNVSADRLSASIGWDGGAPSGVKCLLTSAVATPSVKTLYGLDGDGGSEIVQVEICAEESDGGSPTLPAGMIPLVETYEISDGGSEQMRVWMRGKTQFPCACSTGSNCEAFTPNLFDGGSWSAAPKSGNTLPRGWWRGTGCVRKSCVEAVISSMPAECHP